jgi:hypothetical protein
VINGQFVGIEVKAPIGKQSENQKEFQAQLEAAGGKYTWCKPRGSSGQQVPIVGAR